MLIALVESPVATLLGFVTKLFGGLGKIIWRNLPELELETSISEGVRGLRDDGGGWAM